MAKYIPEGKLCFGKENLKLYIFLLGAELFAPLIPASLHMMDWQANGSSKDQYMVAKTFFLLILSMKIYFFKEHTGGPCNSRICGK